MQQQTAPQPQAQKMQTKRRKELLNVQSDLEPAKQLWASWMKHFRQRGSVDHASEAEQMKILRWTTRGSGEDLEVMAEAEAAGSVGEAAEITHEDDKATALLAL